MKKLSGILATLFLVILTFVCNSGHSQLTPIKQQDGTEVMVYKIEANVMGIKIRMMVQLQDNKYVKNLNPYKTAYWIQKEGCKKSTYADFNDWHMPNQHEMMVLWSYRDLIGGFDKSEKSAYWFDGGNDKPISEEKIGDLKKALYMDDSKKIIETSPNTSLRCRSVRSF